MKVERFDWYNLIPVSIVILTLIAGYVVWEWTSTRNSRPMTAEERFEDIKTISRELNREFTVADFEGVKDTDLRLLISSRGVSDRGTYEIWENNIPGHKSADGRTFVAKQQIYAIKIWEVRSVFLSSKNTYLSKVFYKGYHTSPEKTSKVLEISPTDAQKIWEKAYQ